MHNLKDETGKRYGWLTVLERAKRAEYGSAYWTCKCSCGNIKEVRGNDLRKKKGTTSCGCKDRLRRFNLPKAKMLQNEMENFDEL